MLWGREQPWHAGERKASWTHLTSDLAPLRLMGWMGMEQRLEAVRDAKEENSE